MELKTIRGYTPDEATKLMIEPLGAKAYKKHPTKSYLTTISPAYTRERLTKVFGMMGIGWGLDWEPEHVREYETTTKKGQTRYHFAFIKADFWYMMETDGERNTFHIPVTGENDNDNLGDAMSGARTSAIGQGAKELLFQLHVYKDMPAPPKEQVKRNNPAKKKIAPVIQPSEVELSTRDDYEQHISPANETKRDAPTVKAALMELADGKDGNPTEGQLKYARASLSKLVNANATDAKSIIYFLFGKESSSDLTSGEASALIDWAGSNKDNSWTPNPTSITEAAAIVTAQNVANGQRPLFDDDPNTGNNYDD